MYTQIANSVAFKTITLSEEAYDLLKANKKDKESFSDVIKKTFKRPKSSFLDFVGSAAAIVFTLPKDDALTGVSRCMNRMGLIRGDNIKMRYRRLDFSCSRNKTEAWIAITRGADE